MPDEHEQARLQIVMQEKLHYMSELLDYNKRLDRTVVLYISAVYAAIGLRATDKLDFSKLENDQCVSLALLFIFLNACILLHGFREVVGPCLSPSLFISSWTANCCQWQGMRYQEIGVRRRTLTMSMFSVGMIGETKSKVWRMTPGKKFLFFGYYWYWRVPFVR